MRRIIFALILLFAASFNSYPASTYVFTAADMSADAPPLLKLDSGSGKFAQGKTAVLYFVSNKEGLEIEGSFQGKDIKVYPYPKMGRNYYRAVIGFSIDDPGNKNYIMVLKVRDKNNERTEYHYKVFVKTTYFAAISFSLKPKKMQMLMPDTIREDWKKIEDIVVEENDQSYINGAFIRPTTGRISMPFGLRQNINGEMSGTHRGQDYANKLGTPVVASNNGLVRLAERLPAHGNCVVVEHGEGIFTYYAHLSKILVQPGQMVKKGDRIGLMGATGVATGPHLHFAMNVHNLRVDPQQWIDGVVKD
jgi:murein DD-endopeptidase MepM/ murein hydrolase activator NlpD